MRTTMGAKLRGLHLLLTYQCDLECDHCFVWGSPWQSGTMTLSQIGEIVRQARVLGTIQSIYFEGGEPFLYYPVLLWGAREAAQAGFEVGVVTNGYWATSGPDAVEWLRPLAGLIQDLSISSDLYHWSEKLSQQAQNAMFAADTLGIPRGLISIAQPEGVDAARAVGQLPPGESAIMYRGRAAQKLAPRAAKEPWTQFTSCPHENLSDPGRVHPDPLGHVHLCQGISLGNLFQTPLPDLWGQFAPERHPIAGPLLEGGPAELARRYGVDHDEAYADACHLCHDVRLALRERFPDILTPDQMYGVSN